MKLQQVTIQNYRAIKHLQLPLDPSMTVFHGDNAHGKTSVLSAIAVGLGSIPRLLPDVSGIDFLKTDRRGHSPMHIALSTLDGVSWGRRRNFGARGPAVLRDLREAMLKITNADQEEKEPIDLPIIAFYSTDRAVFDVPQRSRGPKDALSRYAALEGALSARTNFREFFNWFYAKENEELRAQREKREFDFRLRDLDAVRKAITKMIPEVSQPRVKLRPLRFVVSVEPALGHQETLEINQLSGGYRIMLAVVADLARRMAQGNPHLDDPLLSEAVVLIDEVELHLHPSWQQRVLSDLTRTFPNAQFIVSTHSPQVLTTVEPERIVRLRRQDGGVIAESGAEPTYGAEAGYVLDTVMGVSERPPNNTFVTKLEKYRQLVGDRLGESDLALDLRRQLEDLSPHDPALDRADIEIKRHRILKSMGKSN